MKQILTALLLASLLSSCIMDKRVKGSGNIKTETRNVENFEELHVSGSIDVYYTQGPVQPARVVADDNLMEFIEIYNKGERLYVKIVDNVNLDPSGDIKVYVSAPEVDQYETSGACHISSENKITLSKAVHISMSGACGTQLDLHAPSVDVDMSGASTVMLRGETKDLSIGGSGAVEAKCFDLMAENVEIDISGAGDVETFASVKLDVEVSGAGTVHYKGNPTVTPSISGAGSVNKVN